jgi:hypothetical protein
VTTSGSYEPWPEYGGEGHLGDRMAKLVDGELGEGARDRVLAHLATCAKCKAEADAQRRLRNVFAAAPSDPVGFRVTSRSVRPAREQPRREPRAERWTSLAARIAGDRRNMRTAWLADLDGRPEDGVFLTTWQQRRYALGFLLAAVRFFLRDALGHLWRPVDWMLATRNRRETLTGLPPALLVLYIAKRDGIHILLTEGWGWVGGCGVAMFALVQWLQRVRGIELAEGAPTDGE